MPKCNTSAPIRALKVKLEIMTDHQTDQGTDRQTDMRASREVSLQIMRKHAAGVRRKEREVDYKEILASKK